jgi:hypothetical protein
MVVPLATGVSENDDYQRACGRRGTPLQGTDFFGSLPCIVSWDGSQDHERNTVITSDDNLLEL